MKKYLKHKNTTFLLSVTEFNKNSLQQQVVDALEDCFQSFLNSESQDISMSFVFTDHIETFINPAHYIRSNNICVSDHQIYFKNHEVNFIIDRNKPFHFIINIDDNESMFSSLRIFNKAFKNNIELQISTFYYRIFLFFSQLWNLENQNSYIHAAAIEVDKKAVLFSADSGVGKSSLLFRLSQEIDVKFIADDFTIISNKAEAFYQGRSLSVKPYHLNFYSFLRNILKLSMSFMQRLQWSIINDNRLTYRLKLNSLFADFTESAKIKRVVHLCNHSSKEFKIKDISIKELCDIIIPILMKEQFLAYNNWNIITSVPELELLSNEKIYKHIRKVFESALKDCRLFLVYVPYRSNPNLLYEFLKKEGCLD